MLLSFLGTRGEIAATSRWHRRHTSTAIAYRRRRVVIDLGDDWKGHGSDVAADAVVLTHAHPDHVGALREGSCRPVFATAATWRAIGRWPIEDRRTVEPWTPVEIAGLVFEAVPVEHSIRAPAVGYRVTAGGATTFYVPDIAALPKPRRALAGVSIYVGDGATLTRPLLKRRQDVVIGHAPIAAQLDWCSRHGVPRAIFTHCGSQIVGADPAAMRERIAALGRAHGVAAILAYDGLRVRVSDRS
jgi:phosphoribosyl 1,2-cyclic phosphodiesterase